MLWLINEALYDCRGITAPQTDIIVQTFVVAVKWGLGERRERQVCSDWLVFKPKR